MERQSKTRYIGLAIALACCVAVTVIALVFFSQPDFHSRTDESFKRLIDYFVDLWNTMPWGIIILVGALAVPLLGLLVITPLDELMRKLPFGKLLINRVKLSFDLTPGVRFLPALVTILYFIVASFAQGSDGTADFNVDNYNPIGQHYSGTEWINWVYVAVVTFLLMLIIAEGIVNGGVWGMFLHVPIIIAANIYIVVLALAIMFVAVTLLGFIGKLLAAAIVVPAFAAVGKTKTEVRYIEKTN